MATQANGKAALVTGASRGIGRAIAIGLAQAGFDLVLNDIQRQAGELDDVRRDIESMGRKAYVAIADVSKKAEVVEMVKNAIAAAGHIDAVVNNAGILISSPVETLDESVWDAVLDVNAKGAFLVIQALLPHMKARKYGRIVNIASIGGKHGAPEQAHYSASKAAIMGFTRVLAQEIGGDGITANCLCPGIIVTEMGKTNLSDQKNIDKWVGVTALRRLGQPEDIAGPAVFLASDLARYITGVTLPVDGGFLAY